MFKSFFPKPGPFFLSAFIWAIVAVIFWQAGGGDWVARMRNGRRAYQRRPFLVAELPDFLCLLRALCRAVCAVLVSLQSASLAVLVNSWHLADYLRHLVSR